MKDKEKKLLIILSLFLSGCSIFSNKEEENTENTLNSENEEEIIEDEYEVSQELEAWLPRVENKVYAYEGINSEFAELLITPQFNQDNYYQFVNNNGGTTVAEVHKYQDDSVVRVFSRPETYFRENFTDVGIITDYEDDEMILKKPIAKGTKWENKDSKYEITELDKEISVPAGTYSTIEVTEQTEDSVIRRYYAENIGLVQEIFESEEMTIESNLEKIEEKEENIHFNVFIGDEQAEGLIRYEATLHLKTNDPARIEIQKLLNGEIEEFTDAHILPENTAINYMFLNNEEVVEIDLSKEFEENMQAGSTGELFTVYGLVNTISEYYGVEEVLLTVEEEPYEGRHMSLNKDETLQFDHDILKE